MGMFGKGEEGGFNRYFLLFDLCFLLFVVAKVAELLGFDETIYGSLAFAWLAVLIFLFSRKKRDEFAQYCWGKAAEFAFAILLIAPFLLAFGIGIADGLAGRERTVDAVFPWGEVVDVVFLAFFAAFEWARFRGGRA